MKRLFMCRAVVRGLISGSVPLPDCSSPNFVRETRFQCTGTVGEGACHVTIFNQEANEVQSHVLAVGENKVHVSCVTSQRAALSQHTFQRSRFET